MARRGRAGSLRSQMARAAPVSSLASLSRLLTRPPDVLSAVEDGRQWHPDPGHGALTIGGRVARVVVHTRPFVSRANTLFSPRAYPVGFQVPVGVRFESPLKVITCIRRKVRREIMFARKKAGKGAKRRGRPVRTWRSDISC